MNKDTDLEDLDPFVAEELLEFMRRGRVALDRDIASRGTSPDMADALEIIECVRCAAVEEINTAKAMQSRALP